MKTGEVESHFIGGIMLLTNLSPGALEPLITRVLAGVGSIRITRLGIFNAAFRILLGYIG